MTARAQKASLPILGSALSKKGGNFQFNLGVSPVTLNPVTAHDNYSGNVMPWLVESMLTRHDDTYEWVPLLAQGFSVSKDQLATGSIKV